MVRLVASCQDTLQFAVSAGLLNEGHESFSEGSQRYKYELTEAGRSFVSESGPTLQNFKQVIDRISGEHWRCLELASTVDFLLRSRAATSWEEGFARHSNSNLRRDLISAMLTLC
jgi:uncharacterized protein YwgA